MVNTLRLLLSFTALFSFYSIPASAAATTQTRTKYIAPHSLGRNYQFDPRDGWQAMNVSDLPYKYNTSTTPKHSAEKRNAVSKLGVGDTVKGVVSHLMKGMKGIGQSEPVVITWYTGHDLLNPSCWSHGHWAPTDNSFACATTLHGWSDRPKCFQFLELCSTPDKCVFVRVVDSCAGCPPGSHHVDLTKAAFCAIADDLDVGKLKVYSRPATPPADDDWEEDLWGPVAR